MSPAARSTPDTFPNVPITRPLRASAMFARWTSSRSASATLAMRSLLVRRLALADREQALHERGEVGLCPRDAPVAVVQLAVDPVELVVHALRGRVRGVPFLLEGSHLLLRRLEARVGPGGDRRRDGRAEG